MIIAYVSTSDKENYKELQNEFTDVNHYNSINEFINFYAGSKHRDVVLLYKVESLQDIESLKGVYFTDNIYIIVVGKESVEYSLLAGKIGVDAYMSDTTANPESIKEVILKSQTIIKSRRGKSNVSVFTGISGGVGTTTITMNLAKNLAESHLDKNVLFLDFASTKAISNLFFEHIQPEKTIIDIASLSQFNLPDLLNNGLEKLADNFYFVPGIQKHTLREEFTKGENIHKFLNFITFAKEKFDFILVDVGVFEDLDLEIDIQELADNIFVITEFSIPSMAILKTHIDIIDKSGWYKKTHFIVNRSDSYGSVTEQEAKKILSKSIKHDFEIAYSLPNDAIHLRECWNEAKLVCDVYPNTPFMTAIHDFSEKYFMHQDKNYIQDVQKQAQSSLLSKVKQWL